MPGAEACRLRRRKEEKFEGYSFYGTGSGVGLDLGAAHPGSLPSWVTEMKWWSCCLN